MPLQNRVAPKGGLMAVAARGLMMGNRGGQFHKPDRTLARRRWSSRAWIACLLEWKGRHEEIWVDRHYTQLFFLDEATALAAGHRPCALCRRADYNHFASLWAATKGLGAPPRAPAMDDILHAERWASGGSYGAQEVVLEDVPDGGMVEVAGEPHLVQAGQLWLWSFDGYRAANLPGEAKRGRLITPPSILAVLRAGYCPMLHPSVSDARGAAAGARRMS